MRAAEAEGEGDDGEATKESSKTDFGSSTGALTGTSAIGRFTGRENRLVGVGEETGEGNVVHLELIGSGDTFPERRSESCVREVTVQAGYDSPLVPKVFE